MTSPVPAAELVARFRADAERAADGAIERLGVAVSGGPDSLAMLLLANAAFPNRIAAATVDHGLRPESAAEAAWVGELCRAIGVAHTVLASSASSAPKQGGVQAAARTLRYRLLADWAVAKSCSHVATAHHADDQAETILMRLARGSGLPGLAGIRVRRAIEGEAGSVILIRPCLGWARAELAAIVAAAEISAVDDPSNRAPRYDRSRIRTLLSTPDAPAPERLAAAASHLADCESALAWAADAAWSLRAVEGEELELEIHDLPREIRRRLVKRAIESFRAPADAPWREDGLDRLLETLEGGGRATLAGVLASGGAIWRFRRAPPRRL